MNRTKVIKKPNVECDYIIPLFSFYDGIYHAKEKKSKNKEFFKSF